MSKRLKIADLKFDPQNARVRTAKGEAMIQESLRSVGAARSIVIDEDGTILAGNGTVEAAGQVGIENVVIVEASGDEIIAVKRVGLTDEQKKKLAYYDNRTGDEAEWDMEQVARDLLGGYEFLDELFDNIEVPAPEKEGTDELPEDPAEVLREKWGVEYGDLWQIGPHRILCGDSTKKKDVERLMGGMRADVCFTSPPYNAGAIEQDGNKGTQKKYRSGTDTRESEEFDNLLFGFIDALSGVSDDVLVNIQVLAGNRVSIGNMMGRYSDRIRDVIYWVKSSGAPHISPGVLNSRAELIVAISPTPNPTRVFPHAQFGQGKQWNVVDGNGASSNEYADIHKATFPVYLPEWVIENLTRPGGIIADPFIGTGTSAVAAHNSGRSCYGMDIDPGYVAVCLERMAQLGYDPDKVENLEG